ncbi:MAG: (Fe-S)-binding protein [Deltaproteobacteria bacterium]|nr:(Fe-S)-binding protein [Deltaproteobacteria bacterium]
MKRPAYKYTDMIHRCFRCGYCKFPTDWEDITNCPAYARFRLESYSPGGRLWLIRAWVNGEMEWTEHLASIIYACAACKNCVEKCPLNFSDDIVNMVIAAKNAMVELGLLPSSVKTFLENVQLHGNPYGIPAKKRSEWMEGIQIEEYNGQEFLYYVGCEGSYDTRAQLAAKALSELLLKAGVSFGVLGDKEITDGNEVEMLGEDGLMEWVAEKNIKQFKELGVKKVITLSPHSYNAFKNTYPKFDGGFEVFHYTQILSDLIKKGKLADLNGAQKNVTFHDPCFLGRWNNDYDSPRKVLKALNGITLVEMGRNKKGALCCGGGGGNFYTDILGGSEDSPARIRVREAAETGADILAVACPNCLTMLEDAVKVEGLDGKMMVQDISEIVSGSF